MTITVTYRLKDDVTRVRQIQDASLNTEQFGYQQTHGLFGSPQWWSNIATGALPLCTLKGTISKVYMGSMRDWPEFRVREQDGTESSWTKEALSPELDRAYREGAAVEIDYVLQRFKEGAWNGPEEVKCVIEIRVARPDNEP